MERTANCVCGQLSITVTGDPIRVSMCNCTLCQRRSGSAFQIGAFFEDAQVKAIAGESRIYRRPAPEGRTVDLNFCPTCGVSVFFRAERRPGHVIVHGGCFADPDFPAPTHAVFTDTKHGWVALPETAQVS